MKNSSYLKYIDYFRVVLCFAILLFHLNALPGGYLAVNCFFLLSGYLLSMSLFRRNYDDPRENHRKLLKRVYLPLFMVVLFTVIGYSFAKDVIWINFKSEVPSVLFGYNNFWQYFKSLDYFAKGNASPFIHLWYIAILLQLEFIFPYMFSLFNWMANRTKKWVSVFSQAGLAILSALLFCKACICNNLMFGYFITFSRMFAFLFGTSLAFFHHNYKIIAFKKGKTPKILYSLYLSLLIFLFCFVDSQSKWFILAMLLSTFVTARIVDYSIIINDDVKNISTLILKKISGISYEIYLVSCPIIYAFSFLKIHSFLKYILLISLIFIASFALRKVCDLLFTKSKLKKIVALLLVLCSVYGVYGYFSAKDYAKEMNKLQDELTMNKKMMEEKNKEYTKKLLNEKSSMETELEKIDEYKNNLDLYIESVSFLGIGDSVMLGAVDNLYGTFKNGYFDAKISRSPLVAKEMLEEFKANNQLGDIVLIGLGANGNCSLKCKNGILETIEDRQLFWINITNDNMVHFNDGLATFASEHENVHLIDWNSISAGHKEYFYADGIHLTPPGKVAYTNAIAQAVKDVYAARIDEEKEKIIANFTAKQKDKTIFFGNDLLLNIYSDISENYPNDQFMMKDNYTFDTLYDELVKLKNDDALAKRLVFIFDSSFNANEEGFKKIISLCNESQLVIVNVDDVLLDVDNVSYINFQRQITKNKDYLLSDGIHLSDKGNKALIKKIKDSVK